MKIIAHPMLALCLMGFFALGSCTTRKVRCPDGRTVMVQRKPEKQWPSFEKTSTTKLKGAISVLDKVKLDGLDFETKQEIILLREKLDQVSARFEIIAKMAYLAYNQDPCPPEAAARYFKINSDLLALETATRKLDSEITAGNATGGMNINNLRILVKDMKESVPAQ